MQIYILYTGEDLKWLSEAEPHRGVILNRYRYKPSASPYRSIGECVVAPKVSLILLAEKHKLFLSGLAYAPKGSIRYINSSMV